MVFARYVLTPTREGSHMKDWQYHVLSISIGAWILVSPLFYPFLLDVYSFLFLTFAIATFKYAITRVTYNSIDKISGE